MAVIYPRGSELTLRQEALNRVREMQRRAQLVSEGNGLTEENEVEIPPTNERSERPTQNVYQQPTTNNSQQMNILNQLFGQRSSPVGPKSAAPNGIADLLKRQGLGERIGGLGETVQSTVSSVSQPLTDLLESFGIDGEKLIILMVMWSVFNNSKDNKTLLMALGYLLL